MQCPLTLLLALCALANAAPTFQPERVPSQDLVERASGDTENGLAAGSACKDMTIIFARGTTETGNVGTLSGPPFFDAVTASVGADKVAVQGVEYPADIPGFLAGGDAAGSKLMAQMVTKTMAACPNTKMVMSGYSQGGQLVHNAATMLDATTAAKVDSVVIFGDPNNGKAVGAIPAAKTKVICHTGDNICQGGTSILTPHLTYSQNAGEAAKFVVAQAGM